MKNESNKAKLMKTTINQRELYIAMSKVKNRENNNLLYNNVALHVYVTVASIISTEFL